MKYALVSPNGEVDCISEVMGAEADLPEGAILLPDDFPFGSDPGRLYVKGGELKLRSKRPGPFFYWDVDTETWQADSIEARTYFLSEVDHKAEAERAKHITPGSGQAMTYEQKYREALAGDGLLLQAEAEALDKTVAEVASEVLAAHAAWQVAGAHIEALRLKAKADVRAAESPAEMHTIVRNLEASLDSLTM